MSRLSRIPPTFALLVLLGGALALNAQDSGTLVIVGGGLRASNTAIHRAFIERAGPGGRIGIIPLASGKPVESGQRFRDDLLRYGVPGEQIQLLPLASHDDPTTPETDESEWSRNAHDSALADRIRSLDALWFTGGDQSRITRTLRPADSPPTAVLTAIREVFAHGGVIGGTSAGAAMQSEVMILGGTSPFALTQPPQTDYLGMESQETGPLILGTGLGFFPHGIIDQHFDRKARVGRLIAAVMASPAPHQIGFGIDEDTAMVFDAATGELQIVGSGNVVVVDARNASNLAEATTGIRISLFGAGDTLQLPELTSTINAQRKLITSPYLSLPVAPVSSLLTPYGGRLEDALGFLLVDNAAQNQFSTQVTSPDGAVVELHFERDESSEGFWGYADGQRDSYSVRNIAVSCRPGLVFEHN